MGTMNREEHTMTEDQLLELLFEVRYGDVDPNEAVQEILEKGVEKPLRSSLDILI